METVLRKIDNSQGIILPDELIKELGFQLGDKLDMTVVEGKLVIALTEKRKKYTLAALLAKCDTSAPMPQELTAWDSSPTVGNEA